MSIEYEGQGVGRASVFGSFTANSTIAFDSNAASEFTIGCVAGYRSSSADLTFSLAYGSSAMNPNGPVMWSNNNNGSNSSFLQWFYLFNPPAGVQSIVMSWSGNGGFASPRTYVNVASFTGVGSVEAPQTAFGTETGTALSHTISTTPGFTAIHAFMTDVTSSGNAPTGYSATPLFALNGDTNGQGLAGYTEASGATQLFTASRQSGADWLGSGFNLNPAASEIPPSGLLAMF